MNIFDKRSKNTNNSNFLRVWKRERFPVCLCVYKKTRKKRFLLWRRKKAPCVAPAAGWRFPAVKAKKSVFLFFYIPTNTQEKSSLLSILVGILFFPIPHRNSTFFVAKKKGHFRSKKKKIKKKKKKQVVCNTPIFYICLYTSKDVRKGAFSYVFSKTRTTL